MIDRVCRALVRLLSAHPERHDPPAPRPTRLVNRIVCFDRHGHPHASDAPEEQFGRRFDGMPFPAHVTGANAEDCPACTGRRDLPYPFICPGTDPTETP
ncbi:hypothetical protein [Actinomadura rupiterrae]|uniref:hypothetical protein n=1 Tax=Actinomadura rupiterrae TaxID=559627 RepID=UPI0020A3DB19|nr:hypothetical protein [Actinomadura rupiterrae]MCP2339192.1 hypothetical protein [Actinomadura rupiterrae]